MASRTVRKVKQDKKRRKDLPRECRSPTAPFIVVTPPFQDTTATNTCSSSSSYEGVHFDGTCSAGGSTLAECSKQDTDDAVLSNEQVQRRLQQLQHRRLQPEWRSSVELARSPQTLQVGGGVSAGPYKPVPPPRPLGASPASRGPGTPYVPPPAPSPALPGAAPLPLHTHSSKFPVEREVIVSNYDKSVKAPIAQQYRRTAPIAPDAPPRLQEAWTLPYNMQNQQSNNASDGYRQASSSRACIPQEANNAINPPIPLKQTFIYGTRADCKYEDNPQQPNGQPVTITLDSSKEHKESKIASKAVTKTYHTLKDMISSRFKPKDNYDEKTNELETGLNNVTDELRKSMRERAEQEANNSALNAAREMGRKTPGEQGIYGRPVPQQRVMVPDLQYNRHLVQMHPMQNNAVQGQYQGQVQQLNQQMQQQTGNQTPTQQILTQQQFLQQQLILNHQQQQHVLGHGPSASSTPQHGLVQARSQEILNRQNIMSETQQRPYSQIVQHLGTSDNIYYTPQYGMSQNNQQRSIASRVNYQDVQQNSNYHGLKQSSNNQVQLDNSDNGADLRSPQQLEREILRQRGSIEGRRTASQPQLPIDEDHPDSRQERIDATPSNVPNKSVPTRRSSHGNLIESLTRGPGTEPEKDSDDGGFRSRLNVQGRSFDNKDRSSISVVQVTHCSNTRPFENNSKSNKADFKDEINKNENIYGGMKQPIFNGMSHITQRQVDSCDDANNTNITMKKPNHGSTASSDYDKNGGPSSNVDSGRGSAAYSSGRRVGHDTSTESDPLPGPSNSKISTSIDHHPSTSKHYHEKNAGDSEWVDIVESELRQILEPKLHNLNINGNKEQVIGSGPAGSETVSSGTPPMPPLSPPGSSREVSPKTSARFKHQSLPYGSKAEYSSDTRAVMPNQRAGWQHSSNHRNGKSKKQEHISQYKKHVFGLETDITSTTTRSLDLSSMLDGQSDSDVSTQDARAIRRQLQGLENMYCEVLKLLGVRKPNNHSLGKYQIDPRMVKRHYGSASSLPSSSVSSRPLRDKRRSAAEHRKKVSDMKGINKRFQRLESHVVTLARSVAHLSSEMRTQHLMIQEMESIRGEITVLRNQQRSQSMPRMDANFCTVNGYAGIDSTSLANPSRVKKLTKFFGDEPPLLRMFLKKLGYEKYATLLENERVGAAELPFLGEERLRALGVPLGPRLRILHEARLALPPSNTPHTTLCIV